MGLLRRGDNLLAHVSVRLLAKAYCRVVLLDASPVDCELVLLFREGLRVREGMHPVKVEHLVD